MTSSTRVALVLAALVSLAACSGSSDAEDLAGTDASPDVEMASPVGSDATTTETETERPAGTGVATTKDVHTRSIDAVGEGDPPEGFGTATIRITATDGEVCEVCMWLADSSDEQSQGLRGVQDLGGPVGMAFVFDPPTTSNFFMFETPTPLSIAWFDPEGSYLSAADMSPCLDATSTRCERYGTTGPYSLAIEMFQGQLDEIGIGPGSTAAVVSTAEPGSETLCREPG